MRSTSFNLNTGYNNESYTYDANGNINTLTRVQNNATIDNLAYNYFKSGNKLQYIVDNAPAASKAGGLNDRNTATTTDYEYDANGNLKKDLNKLMVVNSNYLNLPSKISSTTTGVTDKVEYLYNAQGGKLAKKVNGLAEEEHYMGNLVIKKSGTTFTVNYLMHSEGLVTKTTTAYVYEYFAKDHLGNTRVKYKDVNGVTTIQQATDYYPFGLAFTPITPNDGNKYLYNGKELQDNAIGGVNLDWYDYGARMYDAQIGRWHVPDLLAEYHYNMTPYHYCLNNPMRYIDPFGLDTLPVDPNTGLPNKDIEEVTVTPSSSADQKFGNPGYGNGVDHDWGTAKHQGNPYDHNDPRTGGQADILRWITKFFKWVFSSDDDDENLTNKPEKVAPNLVEGTTDKEIKQENTGPGPETKSNGEPIKKIVSVKYLIATDTCGFASGDGEYSGDIYAPGDTIEEVIKYDDGTVKPTKYPSR